MQDLLVQHLSHFLLAAVSYKQLVVRELTGITGVLVAVAVACRTSGHLRDPSVYACLKSLGSTAYHSSIALPLL